MTTLLPSNIHTFWKHVVHNFYLLYYLVWEMVWISWLFCISILSPFILISWSIHFYYMLFWFNCISQVFSLTWISSAQKLSCNFVVLEKIYIFLNRINKLNEYFQEFTLFLGFYWMNVWSTQKKKSEELYSCSPETREIIQWLAVCTVVPSSI